MPRNSNAKLRSASAAWQASTISRSGVDTSRQPQMQMIADQPVELIQAAVSPDCSYRLIKTAIDEAQHEICVYIYNVSAEHMLDLLRQAKARNVHIRLMYDVTDTRGDEGEQVASLGVELKEAPSTGGRRVFTVCHQKFVVIDDRILLVGSANWAGTSIPLLTEVGDFKKGNHEWLVRIDDETIAAWFKTLFEADWAIPEIPTPAATAETEALPLVELLPLAAPRRTPEQIFDIKRSTNTRQTTASSRFKRVTPILSPDNYFDLTHNLILKAQKSIDIEQQYILAGGSKSRIVAILSALQKRKDEVQIRIIVSPAYRKVGGMDNWELCVATLETYHLKDRLRAMNLDYFTHLHNKGLIIDRQKVIVSSTNWSENSISRAREAGVLIDSLEIAEYFASVFDYDWSIGWDTAILPANLPVPALSIDSEINIDELVHPADLV